MSNTFEMSTAFDLVDIGKQGSRPINHIRR